MKPLIHTNLYNFSAFLSTEPFVGASLHPTYLTVLTPYAIHNTLYERRLTEIFLEFSKTSLIYGRMFV